MNHPVIPVVIIGAGPTGLTAATLLAQHGVECLVLERWDAIYPQPRAVHLDDEVYRILARLGIRDEFAAISRPCLGLRLVEPDMTVLAELHRDTDHGHHGYPQANMFDQPELEALLRANLARYPSATLRGGTEVTALTQDDDGPVRVDVTDQRARQRRTTLLAAYVLGCDGANSIARTAIDTHMIDLKFDQRWLVVDVDTAVRPGRVGRRAPGLRHPPRRDVHAHRRHPLPVGVPPRPPPRPPTTTATSPVCTRSSRRGPSRSRSTGCASCGWRSTPSAPSSPTGGGTGGSSCSATPPTSPRRSSDRAWAPGCATRPTSRWKLAAVLSGDLPEHLLDTYEAERKPHARAMIRLAKLVGTVMTGGGEFGKLARRMVAPRLHHLPGVKQHVLDSRTPPLRRTALVARPRLGRSPAGQLCPNAAIDDDPPLRRPRRRALRPGHRGRADPGTAA